MARDLKDKTALDKALATLALIKREQEDLDKQKALAEQEAITAFRALGQKSASLTTDSGNAIKGTLVEPQRVNIDADALKNRLSAKQWKQVTELVLDKKKLEAAVAIGEIESSVVASASTLTDTKPYVKVTTDATVDEINAKIAAAVSLTDTSGNVKPAAKRLVKPKK